MSYIEYLDLTDVDREAVHAWVDAHGINHKDVPLDGIRFDMETDEYVITVYDRTASGNKYVDESDEVAKYEVRRPAKPKLPWPRRNRWTWVDWTLLALIALSVVGMVLGIVMQAVTA